MILFQASQTLPNSFKEKKDTIARLIHVIQPIRVRDLYQLPPTSVHVFCNPLGGTIAFNRNASIFPNLRFFEAWHMDNSFCCGTCSPSVSLPLPLTYTRPPQVSTVSSPHFTHIPHASYRRLQQVSPTSSTRSANVFNTFHIHLQHVPHTSSVRLRRALPDPDLVGLS